MVTASGRRPAASSCWSVFTGIRPSVCTILIVGGGGLFAHRVLSVLGLYFFHLVVLS